MSTVRHGDEDGLLTGEDPAAFTIENISGTSPICLVCEHAGRSVPERLGDLGLAPADMERHIAYDIGAKALARRISATLDAPLVLQQYSRLVIDANRPLSAPDCIPKISDKTVIPGNRALDEAARRMRYDEIHQPFHKAIEEILDRQRDINMLSMMVTIHSFTHHFAGVERHCHLGLLFNRDSRLAEAIINCFPPSEHDIQIARNFPYGVDDESDYTIPVHGEARGIPHVLLEVRNDQLIGEAGLNRWSSLLSRTLTDAVALMKEPL